MNIHLENIKALLQDATLSDAEKQLLLKALTDADKQWAITDFKLDRTEKVKKTTAILLEETIEELEQKRKAVEAQNRELEVEAALEKVRTAAMAMHSSDGLLQVTQILREQIASLGEKELESIVIHIYNEKANQFEAWFSYRHPDDPNGGIVHGRNIVDWTCAARVREDKKMYYGPDTDYTIVADRNMLQEWYEYLFKSIPEVVEFGPDGNLLVPEILYYNYSKISGGALILITTSEASQHSKNLLSRAAKVFGLAYSRFLDLQKAEAQSRDVQIELALERVRARTMAMQHSDELKDAAVILFQQLKNLNIETGSCGFNIWDKKEKTATVWVSSPEGGFQAPFNLPHTGSEIYTKAYQAMEEGEEFFVTEVSGQALNKHFDHLALLSGIGDVIKKLRANHYAFPEKMIFHFAFFNNGYLSYHTHHPLPEAHDIFKRFAKVFEQTYTRFLDLQKAEAQAREAEIELSLERIRARTMAMHKSEELLETAVVISRELINLSIHHFMSGFILVNELTHKQEGWLGVPGLESKQRFFLSLHGDPVLKQRYEKWKQGQTLFVQKVSGKKLAQHLEYVSRHFESETANENAKHFPDPVYFYNGNFKEGYLQIISEKVLNLEQESILSRFTKVFQQTYTRFLDLQKAEAQAREAKIELALERVRARAMAMQNSDELKELIGTVFVELTKLDMVLTRCLIMIYDLKTNDSVWWMANSEAPSNPIGLKVQYHEHTPYVEYLKALKEKQLKWTYSLEGEVKKQWDDYLFVETELSHLPDFVITGMKAPDRVYLNASFNSFGNLTLATLEPLSDDHFDIMLRFAKVFDLTYTRFNDLKQAEAQAREAQIQLALERVRARTMAMQKSEELPESANLLFHQIQSLGMPAWSAGYCIWDEDKKSITAWMSSEGVLQPPFKAPTTEDELFIQMRKGAELGNSLHVVEMGGEKLVAHYQYMRKLPVMDHILDSIIEAGHPLPTFQIMHQAYFSKGFLLIITYEPVPLSYDIFKRFASVFDQTYTRFLDLQKAEAQARESQIQLALERVRARTMAMQHSNELSEVSSLLFHQLKSLNIHCYSSGFTIWDNDDLISWMCNADGSMNPPFRMPIDEEAWHSRQYESWKKREDFIVSDMAGEKMESYFRYLRSFPLLDEAFGKSIAAGHAMPERQVHHVANFLYGNLLFITLEPAPLAHEIFKRFSKVFEQTYTRFLDLQKAEAQVKEARIEAALEKVRSRSLAMHHSDELKQVVASLFERLIELNISFDGALIFLFEKETRSIRLWIATNHLADPVKIDLPFDEEMVNNTILKDLWYTIEQGASIFNRSYSGVVKNEYFRYVAKYNESKIPESIRQIQIEKESWTAFLAAGKNSIIGFDSWSGHITTDDDFQILKRFVTVFDQAYTRFLDLQKAEAQAREAQVEAALEKVRSRSLAMHQSEELQEVVNTVFDRFKDLNIEIDSANIAFFKEGTKDFDYWIASPVQKRSAVFHIPYVDWGITRDLMDAREKGMDFFEKSYSKEEKNEWFRAAFEQTDFKYLLEDRKKYILESPGITVGLAFAKNTGVQFNRYSTKALIEYEVDVLKRFSKVFEQAYTRFLDLQKAEAQAREAKIEAALERVRAKTMAMHTSKELLSVISTLSEQFQLLDFKIDSANFNTSYREKDWNLWLYNPGTSMYPDQLCIPYIDHPYFNRTIEALAQGADFNSFAFSKEDKDTFLDHLYANTFAKNVSEERKKYTYDAPGFAWSAVYLKNTALTIANYDSEPYTEEQNIILRRFGNVFEQTYTRFLDLQKAESQAIEAKIEAALEKVRSRSLAMHNSNEMEYVITIVFEKLRELRVNMDSACIMTFTEGDTGHTTWAAQPDLFYVSRVYVPYFDHPLHSSIYEARKKGEGFISQTWSVEEKNSFWKWAFENTDYKNSSDELKQTVFDFKAWGFTGEVLKNSATLLVSYSEKIYTEQEKEIVKRFAKVFEQAYIRFLDLQKAEAQAREAQIEASLERVRSRSMAMHKSDDLHEVIKVVTEQLVGLGIIFNVANFAKVHDDGSWDLWLSSPEQTYPACIYVPYLDHKIFNQLIEVISAGIDFTNDAYHNVYTKEEKNIFFHHFFENTSAKLTPEERKQYVYDTDGFTRSVFQTKNIWFSVAKYDNIAFKIEENAIFKRFAKVFEQTYTRFLDLQKAEAQAREAQIEAALERIRSRSLAMHKSTELQEVINIVLLRLDELGIVMDAAYINIFSKDLTTTWLASRSNYYSEGFKSSRFMKSAVAVDLTAVYDSGMEYFARSWSFEEKNEYFKELFATSDFRNIPDHRKSFILQAPGYGISAAGTQNTSIQLISYSGKTLNEEEANVLKRFARVFEQCYIRFQDLEKAEAQSREAQIQASLERVRSKAMSMHSSQDLNETIHTFYHELVSMNLTPRRCGVGLVDKETHMAELSSLNTTPEGNSVEVIGTFKLANHPVLEGIYNHWLTKTEYHPVLRGNEIKQYYQMLSAQLTFPDYPEDLVLHGYFFYFEEGGVYAWTEKELIEEELKIYRRFTSVLSLTYKRYKDLKDAEDREKEAIKQAALDRVRAEIASMRTVKDLERITPLIWNELTTLGVPFVRCGVFIMDDENQQIHTYLSTPEGKAIAAFHLPYLSASNLNEAVKNWRIHQRYITHWVEKDFSTQADTLIQQGAITSREQYLSTIPKEGIHLHFLPFLQGMFYVGNMEELKSDQLDLIQNVADAFSTAYARYEDFVQLESAKTQIEQTLDELKATQKQLIQSEKMASLGELTAGIAHEIQNPLNFVNNFSSINAELIGEMKEELNNQNFETAIQIANDIVANELKIMHHGKRAESIVKGMLQHSRNSTDTKEPTDINALAEEFMRLAYHGLRAKDKNFNAELIMELDPDLPLVKAIPQDMGRAMLNLLNNAFYAVNEKSKMRSTLNAVESVPEYHPRVRISTKKFGDKIEITIKDNGNGIPSKVLDKIFQPFFTTKPTGQGTGLGLSLTYDIIKAHGGTIKVETNYCPPGSEIKIKSVEDEGTEFTIHLPVNQSN